MTTISEWKHSRKSLPLHWYVQIKLHKEDKMRDTTEKPVWLLGEVGNVLWHIWGGNSMKQNEANNVGNTVHCSISAILYCGEVQDLHCHGNNWLKWKTYTAFCTFFVSFHLFPHCLHHRKDPNPPINTCTQTHHTNIQTHTPATLMPTQKVYMRKEESSPTVICSLAVSKPPL